MYNKVLEKKVMGEIKNDETLLWAGEPEKFRLLDNTHKKSFLAVTLATIIICIALLGLYLYKTISSGGEIDIFLAGIIVLFALMIIIPKLAITNTISQEVVYAITDKRLFSFTNTSSLVEVPWSAIKEYKFAEDADGHVSLLCGEKAINAPAEKVRNITVMDPIISAQNECKRYVMYAIPEKEKVAELIEKYTS